MARLKYAPKLEYYPSYLNNEEIDPEIEKRESEIDERTLFKKFDIHQATPLQLDAIQKQMKHDRIKAKQAKEEAKRLADLELEEARKNAVKVVPVAKLTKNANKKREQEKERRRRFEERQAEAMLEKARQEAKKKQQKKAKQAKK